MIKRSDTRELARLQEEVNAVVRSMVESAVFRKLGTMLRVVAADSPDSASDNEWCARVKWLQKVPPVSFGISERYIPHDVAAVGHPGACVYPAVVELLSMLGEWSVPSQMVALTLQAFSTLQMAAVSNAVESYGREGRTKEVILMADDLLPLLAYAAVHSVTFADGAAGDGWLTADGTAAAGGTKGMGRPARMQNFLDRFQEMDGEFAYYATTLQIAVQWVMSIGDASDLPVPPPNAAAATGEQGAEEAAMDLPATEGKGEE